VFWDNGFWNNDNQAASAPEAGVQIAQAAPGTSQGTPVAIAPSVSGPNVIADIVRQVGPSVVRIDAARTVQSNVPPIFQDPRLRQFFGNSQPMPQREQVQRGVGSGFITSADGQIITNAHVVAGASQVDVTLKDGRSFTGRVMGADSVTDIAVIKMRPATCRRLPSATPTKFSPASGRSPLATPSALTAPSPPALSAPPVALAAMWAYPTSGLTLSKPMPPLTPQLRRAAAQPQR
jgi:S1-C subfamily serine protease